MSCQIARADHPQIVTRYGFPVDEDLKALVEMLNDNEHTNEQQLPESRSETGQCKLDRFAFLCGREKVVVVDERRRQKPLRLLPAVWKVVGLL
jgi:hypothetical protein